MKGKQNEKGITLIALVITIIVLLILAGVTINIVFNDGIAEKSETAVDKYKIEEYKEKIEILKTGEQLKKIADKLPETLKELVVRNLRSDGNKSWVKLVEINEDDAVLEENEIKVITTDSYIIIAEIDENGNITYKEISKDNGEPYPSLDVEVLPLEGIENEKIKIQVKAEVEKINKTKKIAKIEIIKDGTIIETREYNKLKVEDIFEVEENGTYKIKAITDQEKSKMKKAVVNSTFYLKYDLNNGTDGPEEQTSINGTFLISSKKPQKRGYAFLGWATDSTATTATYQPGETFVTNTDITLYAIWKINKEPVISSTSVYTRNTTYITIRAKATDADEDKLTYKLYLRTSDGTYSSTPNATSSETTSGTNVDLQATGLSTYTVYKYKVEVTDGKSVVTSTEGTTGTGCGGIGYTCPGGSSSECSLATLTGTKTCGKLELLPTSSYTQCICCESDTYLKWKTVCSNCHAYYYSTSTGDCQNPNCRAYKKFDISDMKHIKYIYTCTTHDHVGESATHTIYTYCTHGYYQQHGYCHHNRTSLHFPN